MVNSRQLSLFNRQYSIEIDTLHDRLKGEIVDPWIRKLKWEGEKTLFGITEASFKFARDWMAKTLRERELQCKRQFENKGMLVDEGRVERLTAVYSNLLAAEEALGGLLIRIKALETRETDLPHDLPHDKKGISYLTHDEVREDHEGTSH